jgi:hypothetical protein
MLVIVGRNTLAILVWGGVGYGVAGAIQRAITGFNPEEIHNTNSQGHRIAPWPTEEDYNNVTKHKVINVAAAIGAIYLSMRYNPLKLYKE